jgi:cob(I)alamin adenosyltransferase
MSEEEKAATQREMTALFDRAAELVPQGKCQLLVLDEMCSAVTTGMVPLEKVTAFLDEGHEAEIVLTGRDPEPALQERADYMSEMKKVKHPYDKGMNARKGVEW